MSREDRRLLNIKQDSINEIDYYPSSEHVPEGDIVISHPKGKPLRLYKKLKGMLWWTNFTNDKYKDLDVRGKLNIGGTRREPNQPAFLYFNGGHDELAIDDWTTVDFSEKVFDVGGNFASDTFTAPVKGLYFLTTQVTLRELDTDSTGYRVALITTKRTYVIYLDTDQYLDADTSWHSVNPVTSVCDMDAGDTAYVAVFQGPTGATAEADVVGHSSALLTWFSGYLLG